MGEGKYSTLLRYVNEKCITDIAADVSRAGKEAITRRAVDPSFVKGTHAELETT